MTFQQELDNPDDSNVIKSAKKLKLSKEDGRRRTCEGHEEAVKLLGVPKEIERQVSDSTLHIRHGKYLVEHDLWYFVGEIACSNRRRNKCSGVFHCCDQSIPAVRLILFTRDLVWRTNFEFKMPSFGQTDNFSTFAVKKSGWVTIWRKLPFRIFRKYYYLPFWNFFRVLFSLVFSWNFCLPFCFRC